MKQLKASIAAAALAVAMLVATPGRVSAAPGTPCNWYDWQWLAQTAEYNMWEWYNQGFWDEFFNEEGWRVDLVQGDVSYWCPVEYWELGMAYSQIGTWNHGEQLEWWVNALYGKMYATMGG